MSKYPYIADKSMYAAVMGACKWIRESGYFNKATQYYADKYGLDVDNVRAEVRKRQSAGQKGKKTGAMKWFVVMKMVTSEATGVWDMAGEPRVVKAKSKKSAGADYLRENRASDYGGSYAQVASDFVLFESETKKGADDYLNSLNDEQIEAIAKRLEGGVER